MCAARLDSRKESDIQRSAITAESRGLSVLVVPLMKLVFLVRIAMFVDQYFHAL